VPLYFYFRAVGVWRDRGRTMAGVWPAENEDLRSQYSCGESAQEPNTIFANACKDGHAEVVAALLQEGRRGDATA
jgi:hypothetical protein